MSLLRTQDNPEIKQMTASKTIPQAAARLATVAVILVPPAASLGNCCYYYHKHKDNRHRAWMCAA
jgi:hypothetical protein